MKATTPTLKAKLIGINARFSHSCLALFYLRNELQKNMSGVETRICQFTINDPYYDLLQRIAEGRYDYLFFSALIWNSDLIERLIRDLLLMDKDRLIIVGGPQAGVIRAAFGDEGRLCAFMGDIEAADRRFYQDLQSRTLKPYYKASLLRSPRKRLDNPYQAEDFSTHLQDRAVYYETSRGCPFFCSYCLSSAEKGVFHKDLDQVYIELDTILEHQPETVRFVDRTFNDNPARALAIWRFLQARDPQTLFHFEIAPDRFNEEMFAFLETVRPGLFQFEIGIQSVNPKTLKAIRRPIDTHAAAAAVIRLRQGENIHLHTDLILGLPFETEATFRQSINAIFHMHSHYIQMGLLKLLPDTEIRKQAQAWDFKSGAQPPYPVLANRWMDEQTLRRFYWLGECIEQCHNNRYFPTLWRYFQQGGEDMATFFESLSKRFYEQGYFWKAATQKTLVRLLLEESSEREDFSLIRELICFDWLRCGQRFLPEPLQYMQESLDQLRRDLYHRLPQEVKNLYQARDRKTFIKTSVFHYFSAQTMIYTGQEPPSDQVLVGFLNEREDSVHRLNRFLILEITD